MSALVIYASFHRKNTEKIAKAIAGVLNAEPASVEDAKMDAVDEADLVGFGSGIYFARFHKKMIEFIESMPPAENKKAFLFSTCGVPPNPILNRGHSHVRKILEAKDYRIAGEFYCPGHDTFGVLKIGGGMNKGRPSAEDINKAEEFARGLLEEE